MYSTDFHECFLCLTVRGVQLLAIRAADKDRVRHLHAAGAHPAAEHADCHDGQHLQSGHCQVRERMAQTGETYDLRLMANEWLCDASTACWRTYMSLLHLACRPQGDARLCEQIKTLFLGPIPKV